MNIAKSEQPVRVIA